MIKNRWVIYCRVSTEEQWKNWVSLDYQVQSCEKFANTNNIKVVNIFKEIYSWAFFDRPQLTILLDLASR